jgi:hypothetical protein
MSMIEAGICRKPSGQMAFTSKSGSSSCLTLDVGVWGRGGSAYDKEVIGQAPESSESSRSVQNPRPGHCGEATSCCMLENIADTMLLSFGMTLLPALLMAPASLEEHSPAKEELAGALFWLMNSPTPTYPTDRGVRLLAWSMPRDPVNFKGSRQPVCSKHSEEALRNTRIHTPQNRRVS